MGLQRWFYDGGRPNLIARLLDRVTAALSARGVGPGYLVALEVSGRRSGRIVSLPLVVATFGGERCLVSMLGEEVNWVRNVRAAGGEATISHGRREEVRLEEIAVDRRAPVLKAYLQRASNARAHLPVHKDAPLAEFKRVAHRFPVFWVTPSHGASPVGAVVGTLVLCSVGDQVRALSEVLCVRNPGGRYAFIERVAVPLGTRTRRIQQTWITILRRPPVVDALTARPCV